MWYLKEMKKIKEKKFEEEKTPNALFFIFKLY